MSANAPPSTATTRLTPEPRRRDWIPVILLAFAVFVFNTTEFAPIALLSDIAKDFGITVAHAGLLITVYAWMVAILSLPLMLLCAGMERRRLLLILFVIFIASHVLSGLASNFTVLMLSRIGVACAHAVFWSITVPLAVRIAPPNYHSRALGLISTGTAVALVLGLPLGRVIGLYLGWRMTFVCVGGMALLVMLALMRRLPLLPSLHSGTIKSLPGLFKRPALLGLYLFTLIPVTGHFTAYSYIEPFILSVAKGGNNYATFVLLLFGVAGFIGCVIFTKVNDAHPAATFALPLFVMVLCVALLLPATVSLPVLTVLCILWGMAMATVNLAMQAKVMQVAPDATDVAMSMYSGIYNIGIGGGAFVGGLVSDGLGMAEIGYVAGGLLAGATLWCLYCLKRYF